MESRAVRKVAAVGAAAVLLACLSMVGSPTPPAEALLGGLVVLDQYQDPAESFETNDGIFVYLTTDLLGGRVCIIPGGPTSPVDYDCDHPAWGEAIDVSGIGSLILPLQTPRLKKGTWRLLGDMGGNANIASAEFTVTRCSSGCSTAIAQAAFDQWKESAAGAIDLSNTTKDLCDGLNLVSNLLDITSGLAVMRDAPAVMSKAASAAPSTMAKVVWPVAFLGGAGVFALETITTLPLTAGTGGKLLWVAKIATCRAHKMLERIVQDPPDPDFDAVEPATFFAVADTPSTMMDELQQALTFVEGYADAQVTAVERYQGAADAGDLVWQRKQAAATAANGYALVTSMRDAADAMRAYAADLDANPDFDQALTQPVLDAMRAQYQRISNDGFLPGELAQLTGAGLDANEIASLQAQLDPSFLDEAPVGITIPDLLLEYADNYEAASYGFDEFARIAHDVALNLDQSPTASFTWERTGRYLVTFTATATSPDLDPIDITWDFGDGQIGAGAVVEHEYAATNTYPVSLTVTEPDGLFATVAEGVTALPSDLPMASFTYEPSTIVAGEPVTFVSTATDDGVVAQADWLFNGSAGTTGPTATTTFADPGAVSVQLDVLDDDGQWAQEVHVVEVNAVPVAGRAGCETPDGGLLDSYGREFLFGFPTNIVGGDLSVFISGAAGVSGFIEIPGASWTADFTIPASGSATVDLPDHSNAISGPQLTISNSVGSQGVRVCSDAEVAVYGLNQRADSTDAFTAMPTDVLGLDYVVASSTVDAAAQASVGNQETQLTIVGTQDDTTVTITPAAAATGHPAGVPFEVALHRYGTYYLQGVGTADLTGSTITADKPIAVLSGNRCADVPANVDVYACDHLVEELMPTSTWGSTFLTTGLSGRTNATDLFRVIAGSDNTVISLDGTAVATLDAGEVHELEISTSTHRLMTATKGVQVVQLATGAFRGDGGYGDPFMMTLVPTEQFLDAYTVGTVDADTLDAHWENIVVPAGAAATCEIDSATHGATSEAIGTSGYVALRLQVSEGTHRLTCDQPFAVYSYGWGTFNSYGYPGGFALHATTPGPPIDVSAIGGDANATVHWEVPLADGGSPILGYEVTVSPGGATYQLGNVLTTVVPGLDNTTDYTFEVRARNAYGTGPRATSNLTRPRASCVTDAFIDVNEAHPFCPEITWMADFGIAQGYPNGTYRPVAQVTRQAFTAFVYRIAGSPDGADPSCASAPFADVPVTHAFCGEIEWAKAEGISTGYADGTYRPAAAIARQAMGAFLYRLTGAPRGDDPACGADEFTDVMVDHPFCGEIDWLVDTGMAAGFPDGGFKPTAAITRQAMAAFVFRYDVLTSMVTGP